MALSAVWRCALRFNGPNSHPVIPGSTRPIFTKFSPYAVHLIVDYCSNRFWSLNGRCHMANNFMVKMGKIGLLTYIRRLGMPKRSGISQVRFQRFNSNNLATSYKNLVNDGPLTAEFKRLKAYIPPVDQQFSYIRLAAPLLDTAWSVLSFVGDHYSVLFHLFARGCHCYAARATRLALPRISRYCFCRLHNAVNSRVMCFCWCCVSHRKLLICRCRWMCNCRFVGLQHARDTAH